MNLDAALEAVRAESGERSAGANITRSRVLASLERSPSRRLHAVIAAVIASMFGASAFAWYARAPETPPPIAIERFAAPTIENAAPAERRVARVAPPVETAVEPVEAVDAVEVVASAPAVAPPPPRAAAPVERVTSAPPAPEPATAQRDAELALYASAHELHFQARDMVAALDAWNRYLAVAPDGKLAPEARFNRIVALVRLSRYSDAARELDALGDSSFRAADLAKLRALVAKHATDSLSSRPRR